MFKKNKYYIRLYLNQIKIKDCINGKFISEKSEIKYNNQRSLIADFQKAEYFIRSTFKKNNFSLRNSIGIIQQMEMSEGGLSDVEKRVLLEVFSRIGIKEIYIDESFTELTEKQLAEYKR